MASTRCQILYIALCCHMPKAVRRDSHIAIVVKVVCRYMKGSCPPACLDKVACCSLLPGCDRGSGLRAPGSWTPFGDKGLLDLAVKAEERWVGDKGVGSA